MNKEEIKKKFFDDCTEIMQHQRLFKDDYADPEWVWGWICEYFVDGQDIEKMLAQAKIEGIKEGFEKGKQYDNRQTT